jgi:hypothetical protein
MQINGSVTERRKHELSADQIEKPERSDRRVFLLPF